jgi:hypothetical protein
MADGSDSVYVYWIALGFCMMLVPFFIFDFFPEEKVDNPRLDWEKIEEVFLHLRFQLLLVR